MSTPTAEELRLAHIIFRHAAEGIAITDTESNVLQVNDAFTELTGYSQSEVAGKTLAILHSGRHSKEFYESMWAALKSTGSWQGEIWNRHKSGQNFPEWLSINAVRDERGNPQYYVGVFTDIGRIVAEQAQLRKIAYYDPLTHLPNRMLFEDRFEQVARRALRDLKQLAMLMIDFQLPNGRALHDTAIAALAELLLGNLRETDTLARVGESEFLVLIEDIDGPRSASVTADKLLKALAAPLSVDGVDTYVSANVGISLYPMDGYSLNDLTTAADTAMLQARSRGLNTYSFYAAEMTAYAQERDMLERQLRAAIASEALQVHYQPLFDAAGHRVIGAEALLRWTDPVLGNVTPDRFVAVAEDTGLIHTIGKWIMREAFRQYVAWQAEGIAPPTLCLNISARQIERADFIETVDALIKETGMPPGNVELEFRESVLTDVAYVVPALEALDHLGFRLSIDGFGTGFSALGNLKTLPVSKLNIDRSFVRNIGQDSTNDTVIRAVVSMARTLGLRIIAEGVETEDQASFLRTQGCDEFQGHLLGRAVSAADFARYFGARPAGT